MRFCHKTTSSVDPTCRVAGTIAFELQPMSKGDQGIIADGFTPEPLKEEPGACRAVSRCSYTIQEKTSAIMQLRKLKRRTLEVWSGTAVAATVSVA